MRRLLCLFGLHKRSRRAARTESDHAISICKYCRKPMRKDRGRWRIDRDKTN